MSDEIGYLAEKISKQSVESTAWLPTAHGSMEEERKDLKMRLLSKRKGELKDVENSQPIRIATNKKSCSKENMKGQVSI